MAGGVVFELHGGFPEERKRPSDLEVAASVPFSPYALVGLLGLLSHGTVEQAVLRGLLSARVADLAVGRDTHDLKPGLHRKAPIEGKPDEGKPDEGTHLLRMGVVPYSSNSLLRGCVPQVESLDVGNHVRRARMLPGVDVSSLRSVPEEGGVPEVLGGFPVPFPSVPGEIFYKPSFEDPKNGSLLVRGLQDFGNSETCPGIFLT